MKFVEVTLKRYCTIIFFLLFFAPALTQSLDPISDDTIDEDAGLQVINLTGIMSTTSFDVVSSNPILLPLANITINYTSPSTTGTFEYTTVPDGFGATTITLTPKNGVISGSPQVFVINVNPVNDPPFFDISTTLLPPNTDGNFITLDEDDGSQSFLSWAININTGGSGSFFEADDYVFETSIVGTTSNIAFDNLTVSNTGVLQFKTSDDTNGQATIDVTIRETSTAPPLSLTRQFIININPINDRPVFTPGNNVTVDEDAGPITIPGWATNITPGGGDDELSQILTFEVNIVGTVNNLSFDAAPAIDATTGTLTFETAEDDFGQVSIQVTLVDDGSEVPPNDNRSITQTFTIDVLPINDEPAFEMPDSLIVLEDAGIVNITQFISAISPGPDNELDQQINFELEIDSLTQFLDFTTFPQITEDGTLSFEAQPDANGLARITVTCKDSGPDDPPPNSNTAVRPLVIIITPVNDPPSFDTSEDITVFEDELGSFENWATNISPGPPDESEQTITFQISSRGSTGTLGFDIGPLINESGTLEFKMTEHTNGQETFEIIAIDNGLADSVNNNTSTKKAFSITVIPVNDPPVFNPGNDQESLENQGFIQIEPWALGIGPGGGEDELSQSVEFKIEPVEFEGSLGFAIGPIIEPDGTLSYQSTTNTFGNAIFLITLIDDGPDTPPDQNFSETQLLTITVIEVNDPPTDILLSNDRVEELLDPGLLIGTFTAIDPDTDSHVFTLVDGAGSDDNGNFTINGDELLSAISFSVDEQSVHSIRVQAFDGENTFQKVFAIQIERQPVDAVNFANAFTPNGDGANDLWIIEQIEFFPRAEVSIFNKEGQRVFSSIGYKNPWDGTYQGSELPMDSYYYIIDLKNNSDILRGTVTILR